jgi:hypothetical protein
VCGLGTGPRELGLALGEEVAGPVLCGLGPSLELGGYAGWLGLASGENADWLGLGVEAIVLGLGLGG